MSETPKIADDQQTSQCQTNEVTKSKKLVILHVVGTQNI